jgi:kynurenine formamidase
MVGVVGTKLSVAEFEQIFESVKNWGRWGPDDELGTLNYITPRKVREAAMLVRSGRRISMAIPINKVSGPDNPIPASLFAVQGHDVPVDQSKVRFGLDYLGMACHGDTHTHVDALCHISYDGLTYNGRPAGEVLKTTGATEQDVAVYSAGVVGRGVLLDIPKLRGAKWLEPGEAVTRDELDECVASEGVSLGEGDILVLRTGHHRRRLELGPWDNNPPPVGEGKAGLHVDAIPWMHEKGIAAFLPDGDGETVPSSVDGITYPIHPLQVVAMGMLVSDSLQFEELVVACEEEGRYDFMVVGLPLRLPGATGSPWNPIAIF